MKLITAPEKYEVMPDEVSVFLAGGICNCPNWQEDVIVYLEILAKEYKINTDKLVVFNPRRENFPIDDPSAAQQQIEWEFNALQRADIFSMYFVFADSDQPICMYELGKNLARIQNQLCHDAYHNWDHRAIISVEKGYRREQDVLIQVELATGGKLTPLVSDRIDGLKKLHAARILDAYENRVNNL